MLRGIFGALALAFLSATPGSAQSGAATTGAETSDRAEIADPLAPNPSDPPFRRLDEPEVQERWNTARAALSAKDYAVASPMLADLCFEGFFNTCSTAGIAYADGNGVTQDVDKAMALFAIGCRSRFANNCVFIARMHDLGQLVPKDEAKATVHLVAACRVSDFQVCWAAGERFEKGVGTAVNRTDAAVLYGLACNNGIAGACTDLAGLHAGPFDKHETDLPKDQTMAATLYQRACDAGDGEGCGMLADRYETGIGVEKNLDTALELYRKAAGMEIEQWVRTSVEGRIKALTQVSQPSE